MDMYAAGFNAWNQLSFEPRPGDNDEPQDFSAFTKVLTDDHLERPRAGLHYTLVRGRDRYYCAGTGVEAENPERVRCIYEACQASNGLVLAVDHARTPVEKNDARLETKSCFLAIYPSYDDFKSASSSSRWPCKSYVQDVVAFHAGFLILYQDGTVATLGDSRYQDCLARPVTSDEPPGEPGDVPELNNLGDPIKHIAAGGYCLAALTESGSIYVWGQKSVGQSQTAHSVFPELSGIPNYSEVDGGKDVKDIALGDSHAILLTTASAVYVIGRNSNGQLGLSLGSEEEAKTWTRVPLDIPDSRQVLGVAAGPRSSFILTAPTKRAT